MSGRWATSCLVAAAATFILLPSALRPAKAAGDRALGEYLSSECVTCHPLVGRQGIPAIIGWPEQFVEVLNAYEARDAATR